MRTQQVLGITEDTPESLAAMMSRRLIGQSIVVEGSDLLDGCTSRKMRADATLIFFCCCEMMVSDHGQTPPVFVLETWLSIEWNEV